MMKDYFRSYLLSALLMAVALMAFDFRDDTPAPDAFTQLDQDDGVGLVSATASVEAVREVILFSAMDTHDIMLVTIADEVTYDPGTKLQRAVINTEAPLMAPALFADRHYTDSRTC